MTLSRSKRKLVKWRAIGVTKQGMPLLFSAYNGLLEGP